MILFGNRAPPPSLPRQLGALFVVCARAHVYGNMCARVRSCPYAYALLIVTSDMINTSPSAGLKPRRTEASPHLP